jgi:hypothetical protein
LVTGLGVIVLVEVVVTVGTVVVWVIIFVAVLGTGVTVDVVIIVDVVVVVAKSVVEVTMVEVESVVTITGSCVKVMTAKNPWPGGLMKSDKVYTPSGMRPAGPGTGYWTVTKALLGSVAVVMNCPPVGSIRMAVSVYVGQLPLASSASAKVQVAVGGI